jgi:hypothetical protein
MDLEFEGLHLLMSYEALQTLAKHRGWQLAMPEPPAEALQLGTLRPPNGAAIERIELQLEHRRLTRLVIHYRRPNPGRSLPLRQRFPLQRHVERDGLWALADADRQVLVLVTDDGSSVEADHSQTQDQEEVRRSFRYYLPDAPP